MKSLSFQIAALAGSLASASVGCGGATPNAQTDHVALAPRMDAGGAEIVTQLADAGTSEVVSQAFEVQIPSRRAAVSTTLKCKPQHGIIINGVRGNFNRLRINMASFPHADAVPGILAFDPNGKLEVKPDYDKNREAIAMIDLFENDFEPMLAQMKEQYGEHENWSAYEAIMVGHLAQFRSMREKIENGEEVDSSFGGINLLLGSHGLALNTFTGFLSGKVAEECFGVTFISVR